MAKGQKTPLSRRSFLKSSAALGAVAATGGVSTFHIGKAWAQNLPNPADVLAGLNVGKFVKKEYREQYKLGDNDELWDPKKDWIRTADWEGIRKEHAGKTVRFAVGAADRESAVEQAKPFEELSGIKIDVVAIPDDTMYDKVVAEFLSGNAGFDAIQFFSPWLGDFAAQGFLKPLDEYVAKWKLPFDDWYETYQANYGNWGDKGILGIPFDCDIQQVHVRPSIFAKIGISSIDRVTTIPTYDEMLRIAPELNKAQPGVAGIGLMAGRGFWATYAWEHIAAQYGMMLFNEKWEPIFNGDAGVKGLEMLAALSKHAIEGVAAADWPTNRAAMLGGQIACNISWQDTGTL
jgi:multiple sugar transport system substrate-binding protein